MTNNVNLKKWASMVKKCRGKRSYSQMSKDSGLSESTIRKWENQEMRPSKTSVDAFIAACPHIDANKIYLVAGLPILNTFNENIEDEIKLGKIMYSKLVNAKLVEYGKVLDKKAIDYYSKMIDIMISSITETNEYNK